MRVSLSSLSSLPPSPSSHLNPPSASFAQLTFAVSSRTTDHRSPLAEAKDYTKLWNELREKISFVKGDKPCPGQGTFGHIAGGYDAGYYGCVSTLSPVMSCLFP